MATAAQLLDGEAFNQLVLEKGLKTWEQNGYIYAGFMGVRGWELSRTYGPKWRWLYQARRVLTSPVGGGALVTRIGTVTGVVAQLCQLYYQGPLANTANAVRLVDEDGAVLNRWGAATGATVELNFGSVGGAPSTSGNLAETNGALIGPGNFIYCSAAASLATETQTIGIVLLLPIDATVSSIVWDNTGAVAGATLAASTISAANTMQAVLLP